MKQNGEFLFVRGINQAEDGTHCLTAFIESPESGKTIADMFGKCAQLDIADHEPTTGMIKISAKNPNTLEGMKTRVIYNNNRINQEIASYALHMER